MSTDAVLVSFEVGSALLSLVGRELLTYRLEAFRGDMLFEIFALGLEGAVGVPGSCEQSAECLLLLSACCC